jgi:polyphosphate kinase
LIEGETKAAREGKPGTRIVAKVNALVDEHVVEALYTASQAGVKVDLIVRGACSLIPGVQGLSENIQVVSVVDRFLEHSRLYYFGSAKALYLSSADCMPRNFFSRLELAFPVLDPKIYRFIEEVILPAYLSDNVKARELTPQGTWKRRVRKGAREKVRSQFVFEKLASEAYRGTSLER